MKLEEVTISNKIDHSGEIEIASECDVCGRLVSKWLSRDEIIKLRDHLNVILEAE